MLVKLLPILSIILFLIRLNKCARILGVFPCASPSHYILDNALMRGLAEAGHDVTLISPFTEKDPPKNGSWREIILDGFVKNHEKHFQDINRLKNPSNPFFIFFTTNLLGNQLTEETMKNPKVQNLLMSNEKFDVVILEYFFTDGLTTLAKYFDAHLILMSPVAANMWNNHVVGNPSLPSLYPDITLGYPFKMSFYQRFRNTFHLINNYINLNFIFYPKQNEIVQKYLPKSIDMRESISNISLMFLNSHVSLSKPQAHVPNMIEIGGFHIMPPNKLPADLQILLDNAKNGVIYFSMGSNLKSKNLPIEMRNEILKAFRKRKEIILWKWEDDFLPNQPSNVFLKKWLPQQDILAHPNVKAFITHGGYLSSSEAVYHGVPIIAIPIFGDQKANANLAEQLGYGRILPPSEISEERLTVLLDEIIRNAKYRENVQARSQIMHDRQVKPIDTAVYWVEYVIRHKGARHLRVTYTDLSWYQYYMLDIFTVTFGLIFIAILIIKKVWSVFCMTNKRVVKQKQF
ncbi:UDP-glycosyltransferase UGT5 [Leptinotarsa decemlineata]|uniref:UDP-glycosyltransferase UGT5 n=1 Tax=Leptinotarsa decemlineata TaxID=7539 RepID=UPI003D30631A